MPPKPPVLRPEFTLDFLQRAADLAKNPRTKLKMARLAEYVSGRIDVAELTAAEKATLNRYIRELNDGPPIDFYLNPPDPGPEIALLSSVPVDDLLGLAEEEKDGPYKRALLAIASLLMVKDYGTAAKASGLSVERIRKLVPRFNSGGLSGLGTPKISSEGKTLLATLVGEVVDPDQLAVLKALLAFASSEISMSHMSERLGRSIGTTTNFIISFNLHGRDMFLSQEERDAKRRISTLDAQRIRGVLLVATDPVTKRRCGAVLECLKGRMRPEVAASFGFTPDVLTKLLKRFRTEGLFSLIGEEEFTRPKGLADREMKTLDVLSKSLQGDGERELVEAALSFYQGMKFKQIEATHRIERLRLYDLLWDIQAAGFKGLGEVVRRHFNASPKPSGRL